MSIHNALNSACGPRGPAQRCPAHTTTASAAWPASAREDTRLAGDLAMWLIIGIEMLTFGLMFIVFSFARMREPLGLPRRAGHAGSASRRREHRAAAHRQLVRGARYERCAAARRRGARWLWGAAGFGVGFLLLKSLGIPGKGAPGYDLDTDTFWTFYYLLTGFHFMYVLAAVLLLAGIVRLAPRRGGRRQRTRRKP